MIKVLIIDDEPLARSLVMEYLDSYKTIEVLQECKDGFEGLKAIQQFQPDLIFLDIQMPKITGFEMLELADNPPSVIFTTAYDEFALKAFEANAIDYLLKPFSKERFDKALQKWILHHQQATPTEKNPVFEMPAGLNPEERHRIVVKTNHGIKIIPVSELMFLEAYDDYVKIHTKEGVFLKKNTLSYYEESLSSLDFVRGHRSYLIALSKITRIESPEKDAHVAVLNNGEKIPLSRQGYGKLKGALGV